MTPRFVKIENNRSEDFSIAIFDHVPESSDKLSTRGRLYCVVKFSADNQERLIKAREIFARIYNSYYLRDTISALNALKGALKDVVERVEETAVVCVIGDKIYAGVYGGAQIVLLRNDMLARILNSSDKVVVASGVCKTNDLLVFNTSGAEKYLTKDKLLLAVSDTEILSDIVHSSNISFGIGVLSFKERILPIVVNKDSIYSESDISDKQPVLQDKNSSMRLGRISKLFSVKIKIRKQETLLDEHKSRKKQVILGLLVLAVLVISVISGIRKNLELERKSQYTAILEVASHEIDEAVSIYSVNPGRAMELFESGREKALNLQQQFDDPDIDTLVVRIYENETEVLKMDKSTPLNMFVLGIISDGLRATAIAFDSDYLYLLDSEGKRVVSLHSETKRTEVLAGPNDLKGAYDISVFGGRVYVLTDEGIKEVAKKDGVVIDDVINEDSLIYSYLGNIYVLKKNSSEILRYQGEEGEFGGFANWMASDTDVDLSDVVSWAVDGHIWVLKGNSKIIKLSGGVVQGFAVKNVFPEIMSSTYIYTNDEIDNLYVLEPDKERVIVLDKQGNYFKQYVNQAYKDGIALAVNRSGLIVVTPEKIYKVN